MRKTIAAAAAALMLFAGAGAALAKSHNPDDGNPNNDHGQCTAFFNGQKKGHEEFTDEVIQDIYDYCEGNIGGNPTENGRYPGCFNGDTDNDPDTTDCSDG